MEGILRRWRTFSAYMSFQYGPPSSMPLGSDTLSGSLSIMTHSTHSLDVDICGVCPSSSHELFLTWDTYVIDLSSFCCFEPPRWTTEETPPPPPPPPPLLPTASTPKMPCAQPAPSPPGRSASGSSKRHRRESRRVSSMHDQ